MNDVDVIVIGSGAGGLTAALGCALAGKSVLVCEQHYLPGGWCHSFPLGGFNFSPGVHYIGALEPGGMMRRLYEGMGLAKHLTFLELNPEGYDHVLLGDDFRFDIPKGFERYKERLKQRFPHQRCGIDRYMDTLAAIDRELRDGMGRNSPKDLVTMPLRSPNLLRWGMRPLSHLLNKYVSDETLKAVLTIQAGDHGLPASRAPAALHASVIAHYFDGGYYPKGGAAAIPRAYLRELKAHGGQIRLETRVSRILLEGRRAVGVRLGDGTEIRAGHVISNADPELTYRQMVGTENLSWRLRRRVRRTRYSLSNISLFAAVDMDLESMGLDSGNYWYMRNRDIEGAYAEAESGLGIDKHELDSLFVTVTTLKDRTKLKGTTHTVEVFHLVTPKLFQRWAGTWGNRPDDYVELKKRLHDVMVRTTERIIPGFGDHLVFSEVGTPETNRYYVESADGNMYGTEKSIWQIGPFAYPVGTEIEGLMMCGSATLGHGVAGASISGLVAAAKVTGCRLGELMGHKDAALEIWPCDDVSAWPEKAQRQVRRNAGRRARVLERRGGHRAHG